MDIEELCTRFYEELDGRIVDVRLDGLEPYPDRYTAQVSFECDYFDDRNPSRRLHFEIACSGVREMTLTERVVDSIAFLTEHPLLLEYNSPYEYLHFSSAPACPEEAVGKMYLAHQDLVGDWRPLSRVLNQGIGQGGLALTDHLRSGWGMLAHGPSPVIGALAEAIAPLMRVYRNPEHQLNAGSRDVNAGYRVLLFDDAYVICTAAQVVSVRSVNVPHPAT